MKPFFRLIREKQAARLSVVNDAFPVFEELAQEHDLFFYSLEGVTLEGPDTIYLPLLWWAAMEKWKRDFDATATIIHTGVAWQHANEIPTRIAQQASTARKALHRAYTAMVNSDTENVSSDDFVTDADRAFATNGFERGHAGYLGRKYRQDMRRIGKRNPDYTLWEVAANHAAIRYAKEQGKLPIKLSFLNQAVDFVAARRFPTPPGCIFQYPLYSQPFGGAVPYTTPVRAHPYPSDYVLLGDSADVLLTKSEKTIPPEFLGRVHMEMANELLLSSHSLKDTLAEYTADVGRTLLRSVIEAGGYPFAYSQDPSHSMRPCNNDKNSFPFVVN
ncbi:MAG: hypothetical protein OXR66_04090 [Candidatus Woesearchaeota archaeon]|nr:hypothetical protein [Candidatus Woesearchaeota archaeon]